MSRLCKIIIFAVLLTPLAWSQGVPISGQVVNSFGQPVPGAQIRVCNVTSSGSPCSPLASLSYDYALSQAAPNPGSTDANGNYLYFAPVLTTLPGLYLVQVYPVAGGTPYNYVVNGGGVGGGSPGLPLTSVQVNVGGVFTGYSTLEYTPSGGLAVGGPITGNFVTIGPHATPPASWTLDTYSPQTACSSIGCQTYAVPAQYSTVSLAIAAAETGGATSSLINITQCGTYADNLDITGSNIRIQGAEMGCVVLVPANISLPLVYFDGTGAGSNGLVNDEISNLTLSCPAPATCADGIKLNGVTGQNDPNDWVKVDRVTIFSGTGLATGSTAGFQNCIDIVNRSIWAHFENISCAGSRGNGINIVPASSAQAVNDLSFHKVRSSGNWNYGAYINSPNTVNPIEGLSFIDSDIELNGNNTSLANCAGLYSTGTAQAVSVNTTYENNCAGNTADSTFADVRLTGTYNQAFSFYSNIFNQSGSEWGIYNDTTQAGGTIDGNRFSSISHSISLATSAASSQIHLGFNFNSVPSITADANGDTHVHGDFPLIFDYSECSGSNPCSVSGSTLTLGLSGQNTAYVAGGPYTIANIVPNAPAGQLLFLSPLNNTMTLTFAGTAPGALENSLGLTTGTLHVGDVSEWYSDGTNWNLIDNSLNTQSLLASANTWSMSQILGAGAVLPNNVYFSAKNSGGTAGEILGVTSGNNVEVGDVNGDFSGTVHFWFDGVVYEQFTTNLITFIKAVSGTSASFTGVDQAAGFTATSAAPSVTAGQIGYGSTVVASSFCGSLSGAAGCIVVNVAGTVHYTPYY